MANRYEEVLILRKEVIRLSNENNFLNQKLKDWGNVAILAAKLTTIAEDKIESYKELVDIYRNERDFLYNTYFK